MIETLETLIKTKRPALHAALNSGVSAATLAAFEQHFGHTLPVLFRQLYQWHDGQDHLFFEDFHPSQGVMFMCLEDIQTTMADLQELLEIGDLQPGLWSASWLPFMDNGGGNHICLDFSGPDEPKVVYHDHERPDGDTLANNLYDYIQMVIDEYRAMPEAG